MKVSEIKELYGQGKSQEVAEQIQIKKYISVGEKSLFIKNIIEQSLSENENGMSVCDYIQKNIAWDMNILLFYTDIELDGEDVVSDYDFLVESGVMKVIKDIIPESEKYLLSDILYEEINQKINISNSIESIVLKGVTKLVEVIDKNTNPKQLKNLIKEAGKQFKDFDPSKLSQIQEMLKVVK
jgi:hypothetical protein